MAESTASTTSTTTSTVTPPTAVAADWTAGFNDEMKGYINNKGFKDVSTLADSYRNLEKLIGVPKEQIMKLPASLRDEKGAWTPEGRAVFERLGLPKEAKEYGLKFKDGMVDPKIAEALPNWFLEAGIPKDAANAIVTSLQNFQQAAQAQAVEDYKAKATAAEANLKKEWGGAYEQNITLAKEATRVLGLETSQLNAFEQVLGHEGAMKLLQKVAGAVREDNFTSGRSANTQMTPDQAKSQIKDLQKDLDFGSRLMRGEVEAKTKWEGLHKQAYPGDFNI